MKKGTMNEQLKRETDLLFNLYQASRNSFNERRSYEWKLCFAIWTVFAVFISIMLRSEIENENICKLLLGTIVVGAIITFIHGFWLYGVTIANEIDKKIALDYENGIKNLIGFEFKKDTENAINHIKILNFLEKYFRKDLVKFFEEYWLYWSMLTQLGITIILYLSAVFTIWYVMQQ